MARFTNEEAVFMAGFEAGRKTADEYKFTAARKTAFEYDDPITYQKICEQVADLIPGGKGVVTVYDNAAEVWTWRSWASSFYLECLDGSIGDVKQRCQSVMEGLNRGYNVCWDGVTDNITRISYDWDCAEWHKYWMVPPFEKTSGIIASERNAFIAGFVAGRKHAARSHIKISGSPDKWDCIRLYRTSDAPDSVIAGIMTDWYYKAKEYGDVGSCVLGAGFQFEYKGRWYFMPPQGPYQRSLSWEASKDDIQQQLEAAGATNITYDWGWLD